MRTVPSILHLDMDAFFASVEQAAKPSLRGKPVIVGGLGGRGVVSTASYEARVFGVRSAMATAVARRLCPNGAYLCPRFVAYREVSEQVMAMMRELSPLVEQLSVDEAYVDLAVGPYGAALGAVPVAEGAELIEAIAQDLRADIHARTGLTASIGAAGSKLMAKIASEQAKPDGLVLVPPGQERAVLGPMPVRALPGVGPATEQALRRAGLLTVAEVADQSEEELVRLLGKAHGAGISLMARGLDDRAVVPDRDAKSVSVEDTYEVDLADRDQVLRELDVLAARCVRRLQAAGRSGRTVVIKVRRFDFSTLTRSETLRGPTDDERVIAATARRLAEQVNLTGGIRLLGVGVSQLAEYTQEDLFAQAAAEAEADAAAAAAAAHETAAAAAEAAGPSGAGAGSESAAQVAPGEPGPFATPTAAADQPVRPRLWMPGQDVWHQEFGAGWVQGSGVGRVTVRFETPDSPPGRVRTFAVDDPALTTADPLPLRPPGAGQQPGAGADP
ncbi:DNA polymerase IV [Kitasatospora sp. NBC_01287]|uniref:DNA polymerase IV n=1 Tax=Kitasatospora sp. NBC_01287 TaxID=2903573 RepID=UPI0022517E1A|nr:DNA polymerase IV [Kitasatospora sp. NBC_01287]MCX4750775.1 DNA polymerase IV [Kitasatospora sp. NBC_01287]